MYFRVRKRVFDRLTQIVADFVISGWVGWLAGWTTLGGWAGWLGWAGLVWAQPKPQKHVKKIQKMLIPARPKQTQEILRISIFVDPKK